MSFERRQDLPQLGCGGVGVDQDAPGWAINRTRLHRAPQRRRYEMFHGLEPITRLLREPGQMGQRRGALCSLMGRDGVTKAGH